jgi:manganese/iron transport system permease protein
MRALLLDPFASSFMQRALIGVLITAGFAPAVGAWIVLRRLSYLGDAMSHALLSGVAGAYLLGINLTIGALFGGVAMAALVGLLSALPHLRQDAAVGVAETMLFSIGLILISTHSDRISVDLTHFLFGQITTMTNSDLISNATLAALGMGFMALCFHDLRAATFDPVHAKLAGVRVVMLDRALLLLLALAVVASLQSVGLLMSVALLVTPASTARILTASLQTMVALSSTIGIVGGVVGLILSYHLSTPPGATIALILTGFLVTAAAIRIPRNRSGQREHDRKIRKAEPMTLSSN